MLPGMECVFSFIVLLFMAMPVAMIVLVFVIAGIMRNAQSRAWGAFAQKAGLSLDPGGWFRAPTVSGAYGGFNVYLYTYTQGSGKNKTTYTSMIVYLPEETSIHLRVMREGFLSKISKAFGAQDIQLGDPAFDAAYVIKSDTPQFVPEVLSSQIRGAMLSGGDIMNFTISRGRVFYNQSGVQRDEGVLRYILDVLALVARRVVEIEAPQAPAPAPPQVVQLPPLSVCDNCGAEIDWAADRVKAVARCEYCGKEMTFKFGTLGFRKR